MTYDVSFHPISEEEIISWYFDQMVNLEDGNLDEIKLLSKENHISDLYIEKYLDTLELGLNIGPNQVYDKTHGFFIAIIQGLFRKYFYIRDKAFSFLLDDSAIFGEYVKTWQEILGQEIPNETYNRLYKNYSSGSFIPYEKVVKLLDDYEKDIDVRSYLNQHFSIGKIDVFLEALRYAKSRKLGLLEASELIQPNVLNLDNSACYSNIGNCDEEGIKLFYTDSIQVFKDLEEF